MPAHAADLYSAALASGLATGFQCTATNKGTGNITVTVQIKEALLSGEVLATCGPSLIGPQAAVVCFDDTADRVAFCKVTTSSPANTRSVFSILNGSGASANAIPR
jgi:hypothetical protein